MTFELVLNQETSEWSLNGTGGKEAQNAQILRACIELFEQKSGSLGRGGHNSSPETRASSTFSPEPRKQEHQIDELINTEKPGKFVLFPFKMRWYFSQYDSGLERVKGGKYSIELPPYFL